MKELKEELVASQRSLQVALFERDARKKQLVTKIKEEKVCFKTFLSTAIIDTFFFHGQASQLQERLRLEAERREDCKVRLSRPRCRTANVEKEVKILKLSFPAKNRNQKVKM